MIDTTIKNGANDKNSDDVVALMMALCYNSNGILKTRKLINVQGLDAERKTPHKKRGRRGKIVENVLIFRNFFTQSVV